MKRRDRLAVVALALMLAAIGAAMYATDASRSPDPTPIYVTPPPGLTYREGLVGHPSSINPLTARTQVDRDLVALLFRGLLRAGPNGTLLPDLARSWAVSADGLTYTFNLRNDAQWEDGQPVTAADVVFTVGLAQDPDYDGPLGASWQGITATAVGSNVVRFTLTTRLGGFLRQASLPILPEHVLTGIAVTDLADSAFSAQPMGDGPYRIVEIDDTHVLLARASAAAPVSGTDATVDPSASVSDAATADTASPSDTAMAATTAAAADTETATTAPQGNIESIDLEFFDDPASAITSFRAGHLDTLGGLAPDSIEAAASRAGAGVITYPLASLYSVVLNQRASHPEFANLNVRKGLLAGIDRATILKTTLLGRGTVADVPLPSWSASYDPAAISVTSYSTSDAAADLGAAGWAHGQAGWTLPKATTGYAIRLLSLNEATNPVAYRIAGQIAADWRALGLQVNLQAFGAADFTQHLSGGDFDAAVVDYQLGLDPDVSPLLLSSQAAPNGSNLSGVADSSLDGLLTAARTTSDPTARQTAISAVEKYVSTNVLMLPISFADYEFVIASRVHGIATTDMADPSDRYWDVLDWRLASDG
jgi:peptide/nickel transport system substrate-binding protein